MKPENVLLSKDFSCKIADFGFTNLASGPSGQGLMQTRLGTEAYMAPELLEHESYCGQSIDLFALGMILFIMYTGYPAFNSARRSDWHYNALVTDPAKFWKTASKRHPQGFFSDDFKDLIVNLLHDQPSRRLNLADVACHAFLTENEIASPTEL